MKFLLICTLFSFSFMGTRLWQSIFGSWNLSLFSLLPQNGKILNTLLEWNESTLIWVPNKKKASSSIVVCLIRLPNFWFYAFLSPPSLLLTESFVLHWSDLSSLPSDDWAFPLIFLFFPFFFSFSLFTKLNVCQCLQ